MADSWQQIDDGVMMDWTLTPLIDKLGTYYHHLEALRRAHKERADAANFPKGWYTMFAVQDCRLFDLRDLMLQMESVMDCYLSVGTPTPHNFRAINNVIRQSWAGLTSDIDMWTESAMLSAIGDSQRIRVVSALSDTSGVPSWILQQYKMLNKIQWLPYVHEKVGDNFFYYWSANHSAQFWYKDITTGTTEAQINANFAAAAWADLEMSFSTPYYFGLVRDYDVTNYEKIGKIPHFTVSWDNTQKYKLDFYWIVSNSLNFVPLTIGKVWNLCVNTGEVLSGNNYELIDHTLLDNYMSYYSGIFWGEGLKKIYIIVKGDGPNGFKFKDW